MAVDVGRALREGLERMVSRNGLTVLAFAYVVAVAGRAVVGSVPAFLPLPGGQFGIPGSGMREPTADLPLAATAVAAVGLVLVAVALMAAALRTFVDEDAERISLGHFTQNYPRMVANLAAGAVVEGVVVGGLWVLAVVVGILGLIGAFSGEAWGFAGLLLAVVVFGLLAAAALVVLEALYFWYVFVVVEDRGFVDAFRGSWAAVEGNRPALFVLGILVWVVNTTVTGLTLVPTLLLPAPAAVVVGQAGSALATVFTLATTARTYVQLVEAEADDEVDAGMDREGERHARRTRTAEPEIETRGG